MNEYKTIKKESSDEFTEKRSRFIGYIKPVKTQEEATEFINRIKTRHWDATHNVYAYILRESGVKRYSDDGEPQGTAGIPVLDVLEKEGLTDCVVVVTRYFGGILLGGGGLVRAYSHGAKIAVDSGGVITLSNCKLFSIKCDYNFYGRLEALLQSLGAKGMNCEFTEEVTVCGYIPEKMFDNLCKKIVDSSNGRFFAEETGEMFAQI